MPLLARTIALSMLHVKCKNLYQTPKGHEDWVLALCCIDKTLSGWNLERTASICRERCGGQGYLAHNKFGDYMAVAHASLTAEGDNRVLMVKVCKDMITNITKKGHSLPKMDNCPFRHLAKLSDVSSLETLLDFLKYREIMLYTKLTDDNKNLKHLGNYQVLMRETSDVMQELAQAFGERHTLEFCISQLQNLKTGDNQKVMSTVFRLFACECIYRDSGFYMMQGVLSVAASKAMVETRLSLIKEVANQSDFLLDCLNIPKHALYAPIAQDYEKYNSEPNFGEVLGARM
jgi:acyl-CoA oxidase